ncbi:MAG: class I SAM-dependent methyltransferase [Acidobacteriota bacterium]
MGKTLLARSSTVFGHLFRNYDGPAFAVRLWDNSTWRMAADAEPVFTLVLREPEALAALVAHPSEITMGEAFVRGDLDVEGDLFSAFAVAEHLLGQPRSMRQVLAERVGGTFAEAALWMRHGRRNSHRRDAASIAYHYDQPVEFYRPWLGRTLAYSSGYFCDAQQPLDEAQERKLERICHKLRLGPEERFLDIGCGWGSLVLHAGSVCGATARGVTLSKRQAATGRARIANAGLECRCAIEFLDYRELERERGSFDKIASIGMFEHVGLRNLPLYFGIAARLLRPGGLMLNQGIVRAETSPPRASSFIERSVFPDGRLVTLAQVIAAAEGQGLEVRDVENLREHYALTLRQWVIGMQQNAGELLRIVPETTYRTWLLYMAGSAAAFQRGDLATHQILFARPDRGACGLPLMRESGTEGPAPEIFSCAPHARL